MSSLVSALWGLTLLGSWIGWGEVVRRAFGGESRADFGLLGVWGMSLLIAVGGVLNLGGWISPGVAVGLVVLGLVPLGAAVATSWREDRAGFLEWFRDSGWLTRLALGGMVLWAVLAYGADLNRFGWGNNARRQYNYHDDAYAYFAFPVRMLEQGALGPDPFNERRLTTSLGGQPFLQALTLSVASPGSLHVLDPGLALGLLLLLLAGGVRRAGLPPAALILAWGPAIAVPVPLVNLSSTLLPGTLLVGLVRTLAWPPIGDRPGGRSALLIGLTASAASTLKATTIPAVGLILVVDQLGRILEGPARIRRLAWSAAAATATLAFLAPWMIDMERSGGTPLYPLLGKGFHGSAYGSYISPDAGLVGDTLWANLIGSFCSIPVASALATALFGMAASPARSPSHLPYFALRLAAIVTLATLPFKFYTGDYTRYVYPIALAALCLAPLYGLRPAFGRPRARMRVVGLLGLQLAVVAIGGIDEFRSDAFQTFARNAVACSRIPREPDWDEREQRRAYRRMQAAVPPGEPLLARLGHSYLLDFARNPISIVDTAGGASPPPGLPLYQGPGPVRDYLRGLGIRYVAYSYADEAGLDEASHRERARSDPNPWYRLSAAHTLDFQANLSALMRTERRLHDDGRLVLLDLGPAGD